MTPFKGFQPTRRRSQTNHRTSLPNISNNTFNNNDNLTSPPILSPMPSLTSNLTSNPLQPNLLQPLVPPLQTYTFPSTFPRPQQQHQPKEEQQVQSPAPPQLQQPSQQLFQPRSQYQPPQQTISPIHPLRSIPAPSTSQPKVRTKHPKFANVVEYIYGVLTYLENNRPADLHKFAADCAEIYKTKYSHSEKLQKTNIEEETNTQDKNVKNQQNSDQVVTEPNNNDTVTKAKENEQSKQVTSPPKQPEVIEILSDDDDDETTQNASNQQDDKSPKAKYNFYSNRYQLEEKVRERANRWSDQCQKLKMAGRTTSDGCHYIIATTGNNSGNQPVLLPREVCERLGGLLDPTSQSYDYQTPLLSSIYLDAIRYLWMYLVQDPCTGAIFRHGIGFPRAHVVLLFTHIALSANIRSRPKRILIICPPCAENDWSRARNALQSVVNTSMKITNARDWRQDIRTWKDSGGVLICSTEIYSLVLEDGSVPVWQEQCIQALCNPGPDIIILDEATRIGTYQSRLGRLLAYTATQARLALTSVCEGGNIQRTWNVVNWACPDLCGTKSEFYEVFLRPIATGHKNASTVEQGAVSYRTALVLHHTLKMVTYTITVDQRRRLLEKRGLRLRESSIFVNLGVAHVDLYQRVAKILFEAVTEGKISKFIALHILNITAASPAALQRLLRDGYRDDEKLIENEAANFSLFKRAREVFAELFVSTEKLFADGHLICNKLELCKFLCTNSAKACERLVVFTSSKEVFIEAVRVLQVTAEACSAQFFKYDIVLREGDLSEQLMKFNTAEEAAILVAPIGPMLECMEESGWGFINATRIIVLDGTFYVDACAQALNRVHNLAQFETCHVHYIHSVGTVDDLLFASMKSRYDSVKGDNPGEWRRPPTAREAFERSYLLTPEITHSMIKPASFDYGNGREKQPTVEDLNESKTHQIMNKDIHLDSWIDELTSQYGDEEGYLLHKIETGIRKYDLLTQMLDCMLKGGVTEEEKETGRIEVTKRQDSLLKTLPHTLRELMNCGRDDDAIRAINSVKIDPDTYAEAERDPWGIISCWDPYFRTYECPAPRPKVLNMMESTMNSTRSRSRSRSHSSHLSAHNSSEGRGMRSFTDHKRSNDREFTPGPKQMSGYVDYDEPPSQLVIEDRVEEQYPTKRRRQV